MGTWTGAVPDTLAVDDAVIDSGDVQDFQTVVLEGFDPTAHWALPNIAGIPGWRSNEPGALERYGQGFKAAAMVRLMHSMVRFNILKRSKVWDVQLR